nr:MAG TPA: hypothetical protein [Caudoviricetes sp.]
MLPASIKYRLHHISPGIHYLTTWPRNTTSHVVSIIRTDVRYITTLRTLIAAASKHSIISSPLTATPTLFNQTTFKSNITYNCRLTIAIKFIYLSCTRLLNNGDTFIL